MHAGWLDDITDWLRRQIVALWEALLGLIADTFYWVVEQVMDLFASIVEAIPVPDFLSSGLGGLFAPLPPEMLYFVDLFNVPQGLAMIGAGVAFRLGRKLFTLGQW